MSKRLMILVAGLCALASVPATAQPINMTLVGASPAGLWSSLGVGIGAAVAAAYPGSTITYQTSSGGLANAQLVSDGRVPLGIAQTDTPPDHDPVASRGPFGSKLTVLMSGPAIRRARFHVRVSNTSTSSPPLVASQRPSALNASDEVYADLLGSSATNFPVPTSHT